MPEGKPQGDGARSPANGWSCTKKGSQGGGGKRKYRCYATGITYPSSGENKKWGRRTGEASPKTERGGAKPEKNSQDQTCVPWEKGVS